MRIETEELIKALTPFYTGCYFSLKIMANGDMKIGYGCFRLINLQRGAREYLRELVASDLRSDKDEEKYIILSQDLLVENINEVKYKLLADLRESCRHCGSPLFQKKS